MKDRIFKHWVTSLIGVGLVVVGVILMITGKATLTEFCVLLPIAMGLLYAKDSYKTNSDEAPAEEKPDNK